MPSNMCTVEGELTTFAVIIFFIAIVYAQEFKQWLHRVSDRVVLVALAGAWRTVATGVGFFVAWVSTFLLWFESWKHAKQSPNDPV